MFITEIHCIKNLSSQSYKSQMGTDISVSIRDINSSYQYKLFSFTMLKTYMYISFSKYIASKLEDFGPEKNFEFLMAVETFLEIVIVSINKLLCQLTTVLL